MYYHHKPLDHISNDRLILLRFAALAPVSLVCSSFILDSFKDPFNF
jgi:hypothetical protein